MHEPSKGIGHQGAEANAPKGNSYVLAIAIDAYEHLPKLYNCVRDSETLIGLLLQNYQFDDQHVVRLYDKDATSDNIHAAFRDLIGKAAPNDNLLVYFSGHGEYDSLTREGFWIPVEAQKGRLPQYIANDTIRRYLGSIQSHHTFLIADSCFSGALFEEGTGKSGGPRSERDPSRWGLTSGRKEIVSDGKPGMHSPFADALLHRLRANKDALGVQKLCAEVLEQVEANAFQTPIGEPLRVQGHKNGQFYFHPKKNEAAAWQTALAAQNVTALVAFEREYPQSPHISSGDLDDHIKALEEEGLWKEATRSNTIGSYREYKRRTTLGKFRKQADEALERLLPRETPAPVRKETPAPKPKPQPRPAPPVVMPKFSWDKWKMPLVLGLGLMVLAGVVWQLAKPKEIKDAFDMVFVQGGTFTMGCTAEQGSDCTNREKPARQVTVKDFNIGKYEVTQAQWRAVMESNPSSFKNCDQCPVESVSWNDAQAFIKKLNEQTGKKYRLPTESEWEYAARGGNKSKGYKYAGSNNLDEVAWYTSNSGGETKPVGQKKPSELGIYDMSGNVWEWCEDDWHDNYNGAPGDGRAWIDSPRGSDRVDRGGSWYSVAGYCRAADRGLVTPTFRYYYVGFRLAL